nr:MAG TPA: hypothetical protein [Caudoviricetes sp.]
MQMNRAAASPPLPVMTHKKPVRVQRHSNVPSLPQVLTGVTPQAPCRYCGILHKSTSIIPGGKREKSSCFFDVWIKVFR